MRLLPNDGKRVETGPLCVGDDYPGVFIRGDKSLWWSNRLTHTIRMLKDTSIDEATILELKELRDTLQSCMIPGTRN